ncbi:MAG: hypothetical protein MJY58_08325, partial [Bacteroidaceae bacterium]|nr:hypothetical protein [Bacteroidaceae bacterium]
MDTIQVADKKFAKYIPEEEILKQVKRVAQEINRDYKDKNPLFLCVLNGSFMFASDLMKEITIPCNISFVKVASYQGTISSGKIREVIGISQPLQGRDIIVVEDIIETGFTMEHMLESLGTRSPESIQICTLLFKLMSMTPGMWGEFYTYESMDVN